MADFEEVFDNIKTHYKLFWEGGTKKEGFCLVKNSLIVNS